MRILCLHGRGSNNDIFRMQTAGFRRHLEDYEFDFVQGQMPHSEGNWMLHTKEFSASKLWGYYNMLDAEDVLKTERELLELLREDGPYDGVIGYSQGATLACQSVVRFAEENPGSGLEELPFRFLVLFNPATPVKVWEPKEKLADTVVDFENPMVSNFYLLMKNNPLLKTTKLQPAELPNGRQVMTDGKLAITKYTPEYDGTIINIPTLHIACQGDRPEFGAEAYELCNKDTSEQLFHQHKHDFPRGNEEMRRIATAIRALAERV